MVPPVERTLTRPALLFPVFSRPTLQPPSTFLGGTSGAAMAEEGESSRSSGGIRVCVTGGPGFIGSWLVKKLLEKGYTVHATLRSIGDEKKAGLLRRLVPGAAPERLQLFEADLYDATAFALAITGCQFFFLIATPFQQDSASSKQYKNTAEADAVCVILRQCVESNTVKRAIHTNICCQLAMTRYWEPPVC